MNGMRNILYVVLNLNKSTTELVASCLKARYRDGFERIVFFESREAEKNESEHVDIYRKYFRNFIKNVILLNEDGSIPMEQLYSVLGAEGNRVIDLSNGPKVTTSSLYLAASLCRVKDVYCLMLHGKPSEQMEEGKDFEYLKLRQMEGIERLGRLSFFDLVYYSEDVEKLFADEVLDPEDTLQKIYSGVLKGIRDFFSDPAEIKSVIQSLTTGNEAIINATLRYLQENSEACAFADANGVDLGRRGDRVGILQYFFKQYVKRGRNRNLVCLCTIPGLLSGLRDYRNIAAHYSENHVILTGDDARTVINMEIQVLKCIHENSELWRSI